MMRKYVATPSFRRHWQLCCLAIGLIAVVAGGCGPKDKRIRNRVTGAITHGGQPLVAGEIMFLPDDSKQNRGPQGLAIIKDGRYDTKGSRAPGIDGGAMVIEVTGYLDEKRSRMVSYQYQAELGHSPQMTLDIDIPAKNAAAVEARAVP
jgi:hypothetical protein